MHDGEHVAHRLGPELAQQPAAQLPADEVADLLGIPFDTVTQAGLFPVAYTVGTDFKLANRLPGSAVSHWDTWSA